jgi:hypothetical protein
MLPNGAAQSTIDWKTEAKFWQTKYVEQCMHSAQVIAMLSRPLLAENALTQLAGQAATKHAAEQQSEVAQ